MKKGQEFFLKRCESTLLLYLSKLNYKNEENQKILGRHSYKKKKKKSNLEALASRAKNKMGLDFSILKDKS